MFKLSLLAVCIISTVLCISCSDAAEIKRTVGSQYEPDVISIEGSIVFSDFAKFVDVARNSVNAIVVLDNLGGELGTGFDIALFVKQRGFVTYVRSGAKCYSSCANIWLAGRQRLLEEGGELGFHPPWGTQTGTPAPSPPVSNALMGWYYAELGMSRETLLRVFEQDALGMGIYNSENISTLGVEAVIHSAQSLEDVKAEMTATMSGFEKARVDTARRTQH